MKYYKIKVFIVILVAIGVLVGICSTVIKLPEKTAMRKIADISNYARAIDDMNIPEDAIIIGIGEATHGNVEFQMLKLTVLQKMVENGKCGSIVFEMPAFDGAKLDECGHDIMISVEDTVKNLSYSLYCTEQMVSLVKWIQEYNQNAEKEICIYGIDSQVAIGDAIYVADIVMNERKELFTQEEYNRLTEIANWNIVDDVTLDESDRALFEHVLVNLDHNDATQVKYNLQVLLESFGAPSFEENANEYSEYRDLCMANNVKLIEQMENARGFSQVVLTGHNGHLMRGESVSYGNTPLGQRLTEMYGKDYFVIGTEFFHADVNIHTAGTFGDEYERNNHYFCSADPIAAQAKDMKDGMFYLNFSEVRDTSSKIYKLLHQETDMGLVGEGYSEWQKISMSYRTRVVQSERYDGVVYVYEATPIEPYE